MLEKFVVFNKGGLVLWSFTFAQPKGDPVNELIQTVLIEDRTGSDSFTSGAYSLKWHLANDYDLVFVAVIQKSIAVPYLDDLLREASKAFLDAYGENVRTIGKTFPFEKKFDAVWQEVQSTYKEKKSDAKKPRSFYETEKGKKLLKAGGKESPQPKKKAAANDKDEGSDEDDSEEASDETEETPSTKPSETPAAPAAETDGGKDGLSQSDGAPSNPEDSVTSATPEGFKSKGSLKSSPSGKNTFNKANSKKKDPAPGPGKKGKVLQNWGKTTKEEADALNFSSDKSKKTDAELDPESAEALGAKEKINLNAFADDSDEEEEDDEAPKSNGGFMSFFTSMTNKELSDKDLAPVLDQFRTHLISKNVAQDIAVQLCESVQSSLLGKTHSNFRRVSTTVKEAMEAALTRILTPKRQIDILREARAAKETGRPYSIVFVGVNGVGKSTTLAKVCSWLQQNDLKVLIAACDTFRAGAVEQLQVHSKNLDVPLHHRGYGKDAAAIAMEGIQKAQKEGRDVVLVDTAGRMQDNEPLMKALAKLVGVNNPDLVLFVGEALVGNDSVDQLTKFNRAMIDFGSAAPRGIDGIILTKFDTVDDKVGAAISMVYSTGLPIVFTGIGQKYSDLRILDIKRVVQILMKGHI